MNCSCRFCVKEGKNVWTRPRLDGKKSREWCGRVDRRGGFFMCSVANNREQIIIKSQDSRALNQI